MDEKKDNSILRLVNPEFDFEFMDNTYRIRKATLDKMISYQEKVKSLENDTASDAKLVAYCIFIMLKEKIPELTEQIVLENTPANIDTLTILSELGFISSSGSETAKKIQEIMAKKVNELNGEKSS